MRAFFTVISFLCLALVGAAIAQDAEPPAIPQEIVAPDVDQAELTLRLAPLTKDQLAEAAAQWQGIVQEKTQELVEAQLEALTAEGATAEAARERILALGAERGLLFANMMTVVDSLEKKNGDPDLIADYRAYRNSIIVEETRSADFETLLAQALDWAADRDGGVGLAIDIAVIVLSLVALLFIARIVRRLARRVFGRVPNLSKLLQAFLVGVIYWLVMSIGLMVVLSALGVDISPVFALIGGASFILAFAFQDTLGNLAAGLMIMLNRPFDEGDFVDVGGVAGTVKSVSVASTTVTTPDNQVIVIPNKNVWGSVITNVTVSDTRRVDLTFGIGYADSIEKAQKVFETVVAAHPLVLKDPAPVIRVNALGASSVDFIVRPWVRGGDYWPVYWDLTRQMKEALDAAGISIPFPQQDVHMYQMPSPSSDGASPPRATVSRGSTIDPKLEESTD
jgi:small conductance mechanosensitive channel